jgi:hypothetical protein
VKTDDASDLFAVRLIFSGPGKRLADTAADAGLQ